MIFAIVGPSGAGKDTLIAGALHLCPNLHLVRRVITRPTVPGAEAFESVTEAEFARRKAAGAFALDWQAHGLSYGIPATELARAGDVIFNGSRLALPAAKAAFPDLRVILISASGPLLAARLAARGREAAADIAGRLSRADYSLPQGVAAVTILNDASIDEGIAALVAALQPVKG